MRSCDVLWFVLVISRMLRKRSNVRCGVVLMSYAMLCFSYVSDEEKGERKRGAMLRCDIPY